MKPKFIELQLNGQTIPDLKNKMKVLLEEYDDLKNHLAMYTKEFSHSIYDDIEVYYKMIMPNPHSGDYIDLQNQVNALHFILEGYKNLNFQ